MYLHEFNRKDIATYVQDKLLDRPDFRRMAIRDPDTHDIGSEIVSKFQGVFLWVFLVVHCLIQGVRNSDRSTDLQRRLRAFPSDMNKLFNHILISPDEIYRVQTARAFRFALTASQTIPLIYYWYLDMEEHTPNFAETLPIQPMDVSQRLKTLEQMSIRLNGRCKGLLEFHEPRDRDPTGYTIDFLHRTVKDFLKHRDMDDMLSRWSVGSMNINSADLDSSKADETSFKPDLSICKAILADVKFTQFGSASRTPLDFDTDHPLSLTLYKSEYSVADLNYFARQHEGQTNTTPVWLREQTSQTITTHITSMTEEPKL